MEPAFPAPIAVAERGARPVRRRLTVAVVALGALMTTLDATVVNVALPVIRDDFGFLKVSVTQLQWVVNAYALTYAAFLLVAGKLGDLLGRRRIFLVGLVLFVAASIVCGSAGSIDVLIALRAIQGIGAALITPCTLSILTATFPPEERGLALGLWSGVLGVGVALGPLVGGVLVDQASWRWAFYVNIPIGIVVFAATLAWVAESRDETTGQRKLDLGGVTASLVGLFALTLGLLKGNDYGWGDARTIGCLGLGVGALCLFVVLERLQAQPMLPLSLFRSPTFAGANAIAVFAGFVLFGQLFFGSLLLQGVMGYSAMKTGFTLLPLTLLIMIVSPPVGRMMSKGVGPRWLIVAGMILLADSLVLLARLGYGSGFYDVLPAFVAAGIGFGLVLTALTTAALAGVPVRHAGIGSAVINTTRQVGGTIGLAVTVAISSTVVKAWLADGRTRADAFVHSYEVVMFVSAGVAACGALVAALTLGRGARPAGVPTEASTPGGRAAGLEAAVEPPDSWFEPARAPALAGAGFDHDAGHTSTATAPAGLGLLVESGNAAGTRISIGGGLVVGRSQPDPGPLDGDPELSRRHASFSDLGGGELLVRDLASTNGTFVNGRRIFAPTVAAQGDEIRVGSTVLRVDPGAAAAEPASGEWFAARLDP